MRVMERFERRIDDEREQETRLCTSLEMSSREVTSTVLEAWTVEDYQRQANGEGAGKFRYPGYLISANNGLSS